jgi:hypothetical protein
MSLGGHGGDLAAQPCPDREIGALGRRSSWVRTGNGPPGYGEPAQPRHRHPASPRPPQHRHRPASQRPRRHPIPRPPRHHNPMNRHSRTLPTPCGVRRAALAMASPWLSLYPFAVPARRPRGRSAAYLWRCCRGRAGHLPGRPDDDERRKRSVTALSASALGRGQARRPRAAGHGGVAVVVNPRAWRSPRPVAPDGGSCR